SWSRRAVVAAIRNKRSRSEIGSSRKLCGAWSTPREEGPHRLAALPADQRARHAACAAGAAVFARARLGADGAGGGAGVRRGRRSRAAARTHLPRRRADRARARCAAATHALAWRGQSLVALRPGADRG